MRNGFTRKPDGTDERAPAQSGMFDIEVVRSSDSDGRLAVFVFPSGDHHPYRGPEQVKLGLAQLEFRDQLLVFLDGALGIRQGELGALRWLDCEFDNMNFSVQHSYYWRRGGHLKSTKTEASAKLLPMHPSLKQALLEWRSQSLYNRPGDFVFPSERLKGKQTARLGFGVEEEDPTGVQEDRHHRRGLAHISAHGGNHAGRDGRTPTHDPRLLAPQRICT